MVGQHTGCGCRWGSWKDHRAVVGAGYGPVVPVEFLTDEQAEEYGTFTQVPTRPELERFFFLDDDDRDLIALRRTGAHPLGMAAQICTVRYIGRFLGDDPLAVPWEVVEYLAGQLGIEDASCVKRYPERRRTPYEHAEEIQERFKYRDFTDRRWGREFRGFLYGRAWTHAEGSVALFNHAVTWLRKNRVLLPREVDADLVPAMWKRAVFSNAKLPQGAVDRDAYVVCVLEQLHRALNRRDVFAAPSNRWAGPRARLLDGPRWEAMRTDVLAGLSLTEDAAEHLAQLARGLDAAWRQMPTAWKRPAPTRRSRSSSPKAGDVPG
jgi:Domain of unknown function (DUF4158)